MPLPASNVSLMYFDELKLWHSGLDKLWSFSRHKRSCEAIYTAKKYKTETENKYQTKKHIIIILPLFELNFVNESYHFFLCHMRA